MKPHCKPLATALAATLQLAAIAAVPLSWDVRPGNPAPASFDRYHGEAIDFSATFRGFGELPFAPGADIRLWSPPGGARRPRSSPTSSPPPGRPRSTPARTASRSSSARPQTPTPRRSFASATRPASPPAPCPIPNPSARATRNSQPGSHHSRNPIPSSHLGSPTTCRRTPPSNRPPTTPTVRSPPSPPPAWLLARTCTARLRDGRTRRGACGRW